MENETIAQKLRRWAEESTKNGTYPTSRASSELYSKVYCDTQADEIALFNVLAEEIEKEREAIRNSDWSFRTLAKDLGKPAKDGESAEEWLDRWYIPRPLFEDGEPVQLGDEAELPGGSGFKVGAIRRDIAGRWILYGENTTTFTSVSDASYAKRPTKALDTDGEPINVGDTVWSTVDSFARGCVVEVCSENDVTVEWDDGEDGAFSNPKLLTHREPVSLKKLQSRMSKWVDDRQYSNAEGDVEVRSWFKMLNAIMERDA